MARAARRALSAPVRARPLPLTVPPVVPPAGAETLMPAMAMREPSALETTMVWAPGVVPAGMVTVARKFPEASAVTLARWTGALHRPTSSSSPGRNPPPVTLVFDPATTELGSTAAVDVPLGTTVVQSMPGTTGVVVVVVVPGGWVDVVVVPGGWVVLVVVVPGGWVVVVPGGWVVVVDDVLVGGTVVVVEEVVLVVGVVVVDDELVVVVVDEVVVGSSVDVVVDDVVVDDVVVVGGRVVVVDDVVVGATSLTPQTDWPTNASPRAFGPIR